MTNLEVVYEGAAACGYAYELGDVLRVTGDPTGRAYVCADRGRLAPYQIDVFFYEESDGWEWLASLIR